MGSSMTCKLNPCCGNRLNCNPPEQYDRPRRSDPLAPTPPAAEAPAVAVPAGWKLVPIEPTHTMVLDGERAAEANEARGALWQLKYAWDAMLSAAPTPPAAEAPGQEPVAYLVEHAHSGPVLSWKPPTAGAEAYGWVGTPLFPAPPTYADAEAKGFARGIEAAASQQDQKAATAREYAAKPVFSHEKAAFEKLAQDYDMTAAAIRSLASPAPPAAEAPAIWVDKREGSRTRHVELPAAEAPAVVRPGCYAQAVAALENEAARIDAERGAMDAVRRMDQFNHAPCLHDAAKFLRRAAEGPGQEPVAVKPLEWADETTQRVGRSAEGLVVFQTLGGWRYEVRRHADDAFMAWRGEGVPISGHSTLDAAKAAAQADYEQRIRSALVLSRPARHGQGSTTRSLERQRVYGAGVPDMTSAKERAVEAGARAASPHAFNDAFWRARGAPDHHQKHVQANARKHAEAALRAAFPILAEELVKWHDEQADEARGLAQAPGSDWGNLQYVVEWHQDNAQRLRARIQQMAEAL